MTDLNTRIGQTIKRLRVQRDWTLDQAAAASGVSRAMISLIERGEASPTAVVLEKLATAFSVSLASLFDAEAGPAADPVSRRGSQVEWRDPETGYVRRNVSPPGVKSPLRLVEVWFPPGQRVTFESDARTPDQHQQIWMLEGEMEVRLGDTTHRLRPGDCLAHVLDRTISYHNPTDQPARYAVVIAVGSTLGPRP